MEHKDSEAEESRRYFQQLDYRIEQAGMDRARVRLTYLEQLYPNTLPSRTAFTELLAVAAGTLFFLVLPILGLMWLDQPDGLNSAGPVWLAYSAGLVVVGLVQGGRVYQANKAHFAVIQTMWAYLNKAGWPPLTDVEEAAHKDTTPERLLQLAQSENIDVLISAGENPNLPPAGLAALAQHPVPSVRLRAAWSSRTPNSAMQTLLDDQDETVRGAVRERLGLGTALDQSTDRSEQ